MPTKILAGGFPLIPATSLTLFSLGRFDMSIQIGQRVRNISTWIDPETGAEDAYVAFFGHDFPVGKPAEVLYVLRYFTGSLEPVA